MNVREFMYELLHPGETIVVAGRNGVARNGGSAHPHFDGVHRAVADGRIFQVQRIAAGVDGGGVDGSRIA